MTAAAAQEPAPSPAVAPPPGNPRFPLFDSLRGVAAVCIIAFHCAALTGFDWRIVADALAVLGPRSLTLFFVISGFLLYRPYVAARAKGRRPPRTRTYLRRRALRIIPAYWVALTLLAIYPGIVGPFTEDWWRFYFFFQLYSEETVSLGIPVTWSLSVEVMYYLLLPLWAFAMARLVWGSGPGGWVRAELAALALVALLGATVQVLAARNVVSDIVGSTLLGQCIWLALGMALAVLSVAAEHSDREPRAVRFVVEHPGWCWIGAGAALAGLTALAREQGLFGIALALVGGQPAWQAALGVVLSFVMCGLFVLPAVFGDDAGGLPRRVLAWAPVAWLGLISYSLFLYHLPIATLIALPEDPLHFSASGLGLVQEIDFAITLIVFAVTLAVTTAVAAASYYLVELPFLKRK